MKNMPVNLQYCLLFTAVEKVRQFMLDENRPYSSLDVCNRLEKEFSKAVSEAKVLLVFSIHVFFLLFLQVIVKALEDLTDREVLKEKVVSKQKIYYANQVNN